MVEELVGGKKCIMRLVKEKLAIWNAVVEKVNVGVQGFCR